MAQVAQITEERETKRARLLEFMDSRNLDGLVLTRSGNFAWYTGGADNHVAISSEEGVASLLITRDSQRVICSNIETRRILEEELASGDYTPEEFMWWEQTPAEVIEKLMPGMKIGADTHMPGAEMLASDLQPLRYSLTDTEIARYRWLGAACSEAVTELCRSLEPGILEYEIAGEMMGALQSLGIIPMVVLVAVDDRIQKYRHPIPTDAELEKHAMVVVCARKWGLICSLTRLVYFGKLPRELRQKHNAVTQIDAGFIYHTRPAAKVATIFEQAVREYQAQGYPDEWKLHHQGGATGYALRDYKGTPYSTEEVILNQAFAWNPSITDTKCEDTIIAMADGTEIVSQAMDWPMVEVQIEGRTISRPDILVR